MYSREDVELALEGLAEGMSVREVSEMVGCRESTVRGWAAGRLPRSCTGAPPRGRIAPLPGEGGEGAVTDEERAAYEAAMTENQLLRAVLDDLKGEGCAPRSISNRRKAGFGERLRRETGLPLREITAFLRISKSSYEYQRARLGEDRDAALRGPGELAVTDVSELPAAGRKYYLSPVIDCHDGPPASWGLSPHPDSALCDGSLEAYLDSLPGGSSPVVHTDGGGPYRAASWKGICSRRGVTRSMSRKGMSPDNARAEGFFGRLKVEFFYGRDWKGVTLDEFEGMLDAYLRWYRDVRVKSGLGYLSPAQYRRKLGLAA